MGPGLKHYLGVIDHDAKLGARIYDAVVGARIYGAKLDVRIYGAKLPVKSPPCLRRAQDLGASNDGIEVRVQILKSYLQKHICGFFLKKTKK